MKYYYMDYSVLTDAGIWRVIESICQSERELCFLLDSAVYRRVEDCRALGKVEEALTLENFINLFSLLGNALQVDTNEGFDPTPLAPMAQQGLVVVTCRQKPVDSFSVLGEGVQFLRYQGGQLTPFPRGLDENGKAFYLDRDVYVNPFEIKDLTYVYSPRYGYLKLDKSKEFSGGEVL